MESAARIDVELSAKRGLATNRPFYYYYSNNNIAIPRAFRPHSESNGSGHVDRLKVVKANETYKGELG